MKKKIIVRGPVLTQSGYGEHGRMILRALREREDLFDIFIVPVGWGQTGWISEQRKLLGLEGRNHVLKNYNFENYTSKWVEIFDNAIAKHGSWDTRQNYQSWELREITL